MRQTVLSLMAAPAILLVSTFGALANDAPLVERYLSALKLGEVFDILRDEGLTSAEEIANEDEAITASPAWSRRMERIYATDKMEAIFRQGLSNTKSFELSEEAVAFFESELGQRIVDIEISARRALSDEDVEDRAREMAVALGEEDPDRKALYDQFIAVNDLVESNLMGALNSNLSFYQGLGTNPLFGNMDEASMLDRVYGQADEIREDMEDWTMNFSVLAYGLLSHEEMEAYLDASATPAGQILNRALFGGFDKVFELHSFELGRAMAEFMVSDET